MAKFLIEVPHQAEAFACAQTIQVFLSSGSHFLTHAEWGCMDNVHSAWMIVDVADKAEALGIVPPAYRKDARVIGLGTFSMDQIDAILRRHASRAGKAPGSNA